jgi:hypothetical protein
MFEHLEALLVTLLPKLDRHEAWHSACPPAPVDFRGSVFVKQYAQGNEFMTKQDVKSQEQQSGSATTQEIGKDQWRTFLDQFTRENRGAHARLEVLDADIGYQVETENRPFDGVSADTKDGEDAVWISLGSGSEGNLTHGIQKVTAIRVRPPVGESGAALQVVAQDGTTTLLELSRPEAYALPTAGAS